MHLIDMRQEARADNNHRDEQRLRKEVRKNARADRTKWMDNELASGSWSNFRRIRKFRNTQKGMLKERDGQICESDKWAETMASYLEG